MAKTQKARETERLKRKREIAEGQAQQFENEKSGHELNIARLNAIPKADRSGDHDELVEDALKSIASNERAIDTTLAEAEKLPAEE